MKTKVTAINDSSSYGLDLRLFEKVAVKVLKMLKKEKSTELELLFTDDAAIKKYNKRYKSEDRYTDVLSFRIDREEFGYKAFLGEIIISLDTARSNARHYGTNFAEETVLYIIHGILHLFGYDDEESGQKLRMEKKQYSILGEICRSENLSGALTLR